MAAWNTLFFISGLLLIALAGEIYLGLTKPFVQSSIPYYFVDGVGLIREPNAELRYTRWEDGFFVVSHTNSQGFLDREPISPERAADGCHIAFIGDSFVESKEVPIADKFQVRLEEIAARELPHLAITTQAYGIGGTGQINQLPFYDEYARHLNPKLLILVFHSTDFTDNPIATQAIGYGMDPDRMPFMSAQKDAHGNLELRPPDPEYDRFLLPSGRSAGVLDRAWYRLTRVSYFANWVDRRILHIGNSMWRNQRPHDFATWANILAERPCCAWLTDVLQPGETFSIKRPYAETTLPPGYEEALEYTAFGIDQFKRRADRDGANLTILAATSHMGTRGDPRFDRLYAIAEPLGIPVISDYEYNLRQEHDAQNGTWTFDGHWNAVGHQWVAETILEWLKENQHVCD